MKGWRYESYRHSLAAKGIRTSLKTKSLTSSKTSLRSKYDLDYDERINPGYTNLTRYNPVRQDKVIVVDLDNTIADVVDSEVYDMNFGVIDEIGQEKYRQFQLEAGADPDIIDKMLRAHQIYRAGQMKTIQTVNGKMLIFPRLGMADKLRELAKKYRMVVYTAATPTYADEVLKSIGISDLFEDIYSRPFMDAAHAHDELIEEAEGQKPLTPLADRLGVARSDLLLLDDRMDFVGPETMYRWVRSPSFMPDNTQMQVFFGNIDRRLKMDEEEEKQGLPKSLKPEFWSKPPRTLGPELRMERLNQLFPRAYGIAPVEKQQELVEPEKDKFGKRLKDKLVWVGEKLIPKKKRMSEEEYSSISEVKERFEKDHEKPLPFFTDREGNLIERKPVYDEEQIDDYSYAFKVRNTPAFKGKDRTSRLLETGSSIGFNIKKALYYDYVAKLKK